MRYARHVKRPPRLRHNPQWTNDVLASYGHRLQLAMGSALMPVGQGPGHGVGFKEFGCGAYGCVLPTATNNIVLKITTDRSEARFATMLLRLPEMPEGIVRYFGAYALPVRHEGDSIYVLWREEAFGVGRVLSWSEKQVLRGYLDAAGAVYAGHGSVERAASAAEAMEDYGGHLRAIGSTLRWFLSIGMLVTDIHSGNIGLVDRFGQRVAVITDPGQVVFMRKSVRVKVPRLL